MGRRVLAWSAHETIGIAPTNVRPVWKIPLTPERLDQLERGAKKNGMSLDDYLDLLFNEAEEADGGRTDTTK